MLGSCRMSRSVRVAAGCLVSSWSLWFSWCDCVFRALPVTGGSWWKVEILAARSKNEVKLFLVQKHYFQIMTTVGPCNSALIQFLSSPCSSLGVEEGWKLNLSFRRCWSGWKMKKFRGGEKHWKNKATEQKNPNQNKFPNHKTTLQDMKHIPISGRQELWTTQNSACVWNTKMQILTARQYRAAQQRKRILGKEFLFLSDLRCLRMGGFLCFDLKTCTQANTAHPVENPWGPSAFSTWDVWQVVDTVGSWWFVLLLTEVELHNYWYFSACQSVF